MNNGSTEKKQYENYTKDSIKVTEFIALNHQKSESFNSQRVSVVKDSGEVSDLTSIKNSGDSSAGAAVKNQYITIFRKESEASIPASTITHKSIIPKIDFTNKYVRRNNILNVNYQSRNDCQSEDLSSPHTKHMSQMEQISHFDEEDAYQNINLMTIQHRASNQTFKKKSMTNNFIGPSQ